jgi:hypothetical protein
MMLMLQPTGECAAIRAARLRIWRGAARHGGLSCDVVAYSLAGPASLEQLELAPTAEMSVYRGVGARLWRDCLRYDRVLHLALVHLTDWAPVGLAAALAELSPESLGSLRLETALAS